MGRKALPPELHKRPNRPYQLPRPNSLGDMMLKIIPVDDFIHLDSIVGAFPNVSKDTCRATLGMLKQRQLIERRTELIGSRHASLNRRLVNYGR